MRYHLESTLPIRAFRPLVKHSPFKHGMTLEGGAVGDFVDNTMGSVVDFVEDTGSSVNNFVKEEIPGGWATVAAVAVPFAAPAVFGAL